jgi:hypothetical protein
MARETFYEVPESLQENYFSKEVLPLEEDLKKCFTTGRGRVSNLIQAPQTIWLRQGTLTHSSKNDVE